MRLYELNIMRINFEDNFISDLFLATIYIKAKDETTIKNFCSANLENIYWKIVNSYPENDYISIDCVPINSLNMKKPEFVSTQYIKFNKAKTRFDNIDVQGELF